MPRRAAKLDAQWHLDKKVPITLIAAIGMQTFLGGWYISALDARVRSLEEKALLVAPQAERLTRVEEKLSTLQTTVADIRADVKQLLSKPRG